MQSYIRCLRKKLLGLKFVLILIILETLKAHEVAAVTRTIEASAAKQQINQKDDVIFGIWRATKHNVAATVVEHGEDIREDYEDTRDINNINSAKSNLNNLRALMSPTGPNAQAPGGGGSGGGGGPVGNTGNGQPNALQFSRMPSPIISTTAPIYMGNVQAYQGNATHNNSAHRIGDVINNLKLTFRDTATSTASVASVNSRMADNQIIDPSQLFYTEIIPYAMHAWFAWGWSAASTLPIWGSVNRAMTVDMTPRVSFTSTVGTDLVIDIGNHWMAVAVGNQAVSYVDDSFLLESQSVANLKIRAFSGGYIEYDRYFSRINIVGVDVPNDANIGMNIIQHRSLHPGGDITFDDTSIASIFTQSTLYIASANTYVNTGNLNQLNTIQLVGNIHNMHLPDNATIGSTLGNASILADNFHSGIMTLNLDISATDLTNVLNGFIGVGLHINSTADNVNEIISFGGLNGSEDGSGIIKITDQNNDGIFEFGMTGVIKVFEDLNHNHVWDYGEPVSMIQLAAITK